MHAGPDKVRVARRVVDALPAREWLCMEMCLEVVHTVDMVQQKLEAVLARWPGGAHGMPAGLTGLFILNGLGCVSQVCLPCSSDPYHLQNHTLIHLLHTLYISVSTFLCLVISCCGFPNIWRSQRKLWRHL